MEQFFIDKKNKQRIRKFTEVEKDGEVILQESKEWQEFKKRKQLTARLQSSHIPTYVENLSLGDYVGNDTDKILKLEKYVSRFGEKFNTVHLYFWSKENGTQQTTTSSIVGKLLLEKGFSVQFVLMGSLMKMLSEEKFNEEYTEVLNAIRSCDFLIIDDSFDKKKATIYKSGFQIPFLDEFLRTRLEIQRKATCFSSNFSLDEIDAEVFGSSLKNLMKRSIPDPFLFRSSYELRNDFDIDDLWG